ncbi:hypothetical protein KAU11_09570 [Candidatus Babeliales bacterium]|nr:hypothetical protein [Candidatus Babeliales bacterium]
MESMIKTDTKQAFHTICADLAESIHLLLMKDQFRRDYTVRYNSVKGAYVSTEDYNDDEIILRPDSRFTAMTYPRLKAEFITLLGNKPVFAA